ncbi:MAG: ABC transporter substrate-binding protein [Trueperaceae bacterium]|nr:ABC transporter substrate-binding protein [Trueperaceae bacterium]
MKSLLISLGLLLATVSLAQSPVRIGSKIDTEGALLCQMTKLILEQNNIMVEDKCSTGATNVVREALLQGEIDMYPEYTGNVIYLFEDVDPTIANDASAAFDKANELDAANNIVWLTPAPANNTWAIAVPKTLADAEGLATMADLAGYINDGKEFKLAASQEFVDREDALKAFESTYGFELSPEQLVIVPGGNTTQTETAAAQGTSGVNAAMAYGTDGALDALGLVSLTDPSGAVAVYQPAIIVRKAVLEEYSNLPDLIEPVFATLDEATLSNLNGRIAVNGEAADAVAEDYLRGIGAIQ